MMLNSYPKVYNLGHKAIEGIFDDIVAVQEKIDGSQFSFGTSDGVLYARSRNQAIDLDNPGMFGKGIEYIRNVQSKLIDGWIYRGEYLQKPKHNTLEYGRVPMNHIILFDVDDGNEGYFKLSQVAELASGLGLEAVPEFVTKKIEDFESLKALLETDSVLGGVKVEGVVVKNYFRWGRDGKQLMGKLVSEAFKEKHRKNDSYKVASSKDAVQFLVAQLKHETRWQKSVQHAEEDGTLLREPKDIGMLIKAIQADVKAEEKDLIMEALFKHFWPKIAKGVVMGFPEWYKMQLAESAFDEKVVAILDSREERLGCLRK